MITDRSTLRGTSGPERTLDERKLAAMRPARAVTPRPRKPVVRQEVTSGIVCFCGERFSEEQALEFMLHLRAEVGGDLAILDRARQAARERSRRRMQDPEFRARKNARARENNRRYRQDPEFRAAAAARTRESNRRRRQDPEYRARENAKNRERMRRVGQDPEYRARKAARDRERRARLKAEREAGKA